MLGAWDQKENNKMTFKLGTTRTGAIINITRMCLILLAVVFFAFAITFVVRVGYNKEATVDPFPLYLAVGLFVGGVVLIILAALFKLQSQPFLLSDVLYTQMKKAVPMREIESFLKTYKAQIGVAGFFNRLGFSGLSLGTIASAFLVLIVGMIAVRLDILIGDQFSIFSDLAKLLFGAFIGSFASDRLGEAQEKKRKSV